jgi:hypothetical protein
VQACGLIGARGMIRARCPHPSPKVRENKPATSAITSLRDGDPTERRHGYQTDFFLLSLDAARKPYYCGSKYSHIRALFTTALFGFAPVNSARATAAQPPEKH